MTSVGMMISRGAGTDAADDDATTSVNRRCRSGSGEGEEAMEEGKGRGGHD
jgi:hypothetical protein